MEAKTREGVLVIDVGTSKVHVNVVDWADGSLLAGDVALIPWIHPQPGWTECLPEDVWNAVVKGAEGAVRSMDRNVRLRAVSCSFQGDGFFPADEAHQPLYNLIVAMDARGVPYVETFRNEFGAERFEQILGCALMAPWEPTKYYWFVKNRPDILAKTSHIVSVQEFVMDKLGLGYCQDYTLASRKVMRDYRKNTWSKALCDFLGVTEEMFDSPIYESTGVAGTVRNIGPVRLPEDLPVLVGAHDCEMGMFGVGVVPGETKILANVAGTTDHLGFVTTAPFDPHGKDLCIYRGPMEGTFVALGASPVGAAVNWGVTNLFPEEPDYDKAIAGLFSRISFDGRGRVLHSCGLQAGNGGFRRIDLNTTREDLFQSLVEGVTYPLASVYRAMAQVAGKDFEVVRVGNGGAKSLGWLQLKADLFGVPVERVRNNEISSVGAAALAAVKLGRYATLQEAQSQMIQVRDRVEPEAEGAKRYAALLAQWKEDFGR